MMGPEKHNRMVGDSAVRRTGRDNRGGGFGNFGRLGGKPQHSNPHPKGGSGNSSRMRKGGY